MLSWSSSRAQCLVGQHVGSETMAAALLSWCCAAEGIALGVPVFFATGSKWKAIGWAALSGLAEPVGALLGLALQLGGRLNPVAMGM